MLKSIFKFTLIVVVVLGTMTINNAFALCSWCYSFTDACCDADATNGTEFTVPCDTDTVFVSYAIGTSSDAVDVYIYETTGNNNLLIWPAIMNLCGCGTYKIPNSVISANHELTVKVYCHNCPGQNCQSSYTAVVKVHTPRNNACVPSCSGS